MFFSIQGRVNFFFKEKYKSGLCFRSVLEELSHDTNVSDVI